MNTLPPRRKRKKKTLLQKRIPGKYYTPEFLFPDDAHKIIGLAAEFFAAVFLYTFYFFRPIDYLGNRYSVVLMLSMTASGFLWPTLLKNGQKRQDDSFQFYSLIGLGFYSLISYRPFLPAAYLILMALFSILIVAGHFLYAFFRPGKSFLESLANGFFISLRLISYTTLLCLVVLSQSSLLGGFTKDSELLPAPVSVTEQKPDMELIRFFLDEETWNSSSLETKRYYSQQFVNHEARMLGLPEDIKTTINYHYNPRDTSGTDVIGSYQSSNRTISVSADFLMKSPGDSVMMTLLHEVRHCYQHQLVYLYQSTSLSEQSLPIFYEARIFYEEFQHYVEGESEETLDEYRSQLCEKDAELYSTYITSYYQGLYRNGGSPDDSWPRLKRHGPFI